MNFNIKKRAYKNDNFIWHFKVTSIKFSNKSTCFLSGSKDGTATV